MILSDLIVKCDSCGVTMRATCVPLNDAHSMIARGAASKQGWVHHGGNGRDYCPSCARTQPMPKPYVGREFGWGCRLRSELTQRHIDIMVGIENSVGTALKKGEIGKQLAAWARAEAGARRRQEC